MTSNDNSSGSGKQPPEPVFNWGLTPSEPASEVPGLLKLPPEPTEPPATESPTQAEHSGTVEPPELMEPPATEVLAAADMPTGLMNVADIPTGALHVSDLPTAAISSVDLPTAAMDMPSRHQSQMPAAVDPALDGATEVLGAHPISTAGPEGESVEHDAVGALFSDDQFVEYEELPRSALVPAVINRPREPQAPRPPIPRGQLFAISIAAGLVAALALTALFLAGTRIGESATPAAVTTPAPTETGSAAPSLGPLPVGTYAWNELLGGECVDPFDSAWQDEYAVIECAKPHAAQLLVRGQFDDAVSAPYPEVEGLAARMTSLCSTDTIINFEAAKSFADLELVASFAPTANKWEAGQRDYYCFVTRSGDEALTESVAQPQAAAETSGE